MNNTTVNHVYLEFEKVIQKRIKFFKKRLKDEPDKIINKDEYKTYLDKLVNLKLWAIKKIKLL